MKQKIIKNTLSCANIVKGSKSKAIKQTKIKKQNTNIKRNIPTADPQAMQIAQAMSQYRYGSRLPGFN